VVAGVRNCSDGDCDNDCGTNCYCDCDGDSGAVDDDINIDEINISSSVQSSAC
jgi:hypothetical protein